MRPVNYFIKRFEYALKSAGKDRKATIHLNENDLEALNQIIEFYQTNYKNTQLEDSLLLFYLLQNWKVENSKNEELRMTEKSHGIFAISDSLRIFQKIGMMLYPKKNIIQQITDELWIHQAANGIPKDQWITEEIVTEILEKELQIAKTQFPFLKQLNGSSVVKFTYPKGLSDAQRKMLGLTPQ